MRLALFHPDQILGQGLEALDASLPQLEERFQIIAILVLFRVLLAKPNERWDDLRKQRSRLFADASDEGAQANDLASQLRALLLGQGVNRFGACARSSRGEGLDARLENLGEEVSLQIHCQRAEAENGLLLDEGASGVRRREEAQ